MLRDATVTAVGYPVGTVVCVQAKGMKEAWCIATNTTDRPARALINLYAKRWGIECGFRDTKDIRFGMDMDSAHVSTPDRRDRLWLINAFAVGAADPARRRRGSARLRPTSQVQHDQATHSLAVPSGLHALRPHPDHARTPATAPGRAVRRNAGRTARVRRDVRCYLKMRGVLRAQPGKGAAHACQQAWRAITILHIRRVDDHPDRQADRVGEDMALAALDHLFGRPRVRLRRPEGRLRRADRPLRWS